MIPKRIVSLLLLVVVHTAHGAPSYHADIAKLFERWDRDDRPGVAVAIVDGGDVVYAEGFGMANIEKGVPIDGDSMFNIASVSKQFTAAAIAKLSLEERLSLDDPIRKYLPDLPEWGDTITVAQLVHHETGIPDIFAHMGREDIEFDHVWGNDDLMPIIEKLELEEKPGEEFAYSNTNYILMAEIVHVVTGQTLREYTDEHFFKPLGMTRTRIDDDLSRDQEDLVISYMRPGREEFEPADRDDVVVGDGNIVTSVRDFAKWDANYRDPKVGGADWLELMLTHGRLNSGETHQYAFGVFVDDDREEYDDIVLRHSGSWLRFRSEWTHLHDKGISVIVFGNHGAGTKGDEVLDIYLAAQAK